MNEWKYQQRRKKREDRCLICVPDQPTWCRLCGCGSHHPPSKRKKARIIKRTLARQLRKELSQ